MHRIPSVTRIKEELRVTSNEAKLIRAALTVGDTQRDRVDLALKIVDLILDTHGVEAIRGEESNDPYYGDVVATYCNTGDTYAATILYDVGRGRFELTSWGDWVEKNTKRYKIR